jgi:hypothetical protein
MSRSATFRNLDLEEVRRFLEDAGVYLKSMGLCWGAGTAG